MILQIDRIISCKVLPRISAAIEQSASSEKTISKNIRVNNEFYVGTSINQLIEAGKKVVCFPVEKFISFGDPFELNLYQYWVIQVQIDQDL